MRDEEHHDVLVVGGGPAGLAAARAAAEAGLDVALVDERATLGGQIWKQPGPGFVVRDPEAMGHDYLDGRAAIDALEATGATVHLRTSVVAIEQDRVVLVEDGAPARAVRASKLVLCPGAHDRPVVFPGWTLPGVMTAGGMQTVIKTQRVLPGERILFAGAGPVALAFPAQLAGYGANIVEVLDAGPFPRAADVLAIARARRGNRTLLTDAYRYRTGLLKHRIPLRYGRIVVRAEGTDRVERVVHAAVDTDWQVVPGTEQTVEVDTLCVGYGFIPSMELLRLAGCELGYDEHLGGPVVVVDDGLRTTVPDVFAAGDGTGVEGAAVAVEEGRIAGLTAALDLGALTTEQAAAALRGPRRRVAQRRDLGRALGRMHHVGGGVYDLPDEDTVVCRCEEVRRSQLDAIVETTADINVVKGMTRAGMGFCQGRNCQRQVAAMITRRHGVPMTSSSFATPRMPARPTSIASIADETVTGKTLFTRTDADADVPAGELSDV
ncbi:unannotated protein [freshwater metagenome]|uniref:Unannotated protein n=1 Tax=freshwater metagenome TaxID=449393 RepID=A0A6J7HR20_9ZZZZ|nr:FAD-dependent oxidoreductase [Actinomycetota bacterium]